MNKKHLLVRILLVILAAAVNIAILRLPTDYSNENIAFWMTGQSDQAFTARLYYLRASDPEGLEYNEGEVRQAGYDRTGEKLDMGFSIPADTVKIRLDLCDRAGQTIRVENLHLDSETALLNTYDLFEDTAEVKGVSIGPGEDGFVVITSEDDNQIILKDVDAENTLRVITNAKSRGVKIQRLLLCLLTDLVALLLILTLRSFMIVPREVLQNRGLIFRLAKNDFKTRFAGSLFGTIWAFVQPIVTVFVYWFVFEKALNAGTQGTKAGIAVPFVLWLLGGLVPWFFFSDAFTTGTGVMMEYSYLVKKVVFNISCLPIVKIVSAFFVHLFFIAFTIFMYTLYGYYPDLYMIQMLYYTFCMFVLVMGLTYLFCSINVFFRDTAQIVNIIMQVGVWFTPIMWNIDAMNLSTPVRVLLKLNPMYYVVMGYRDALINQNWFWQRPNVTIYFWAVTILIFAVGTTIFRRLKVHFADVL
ncbi:MAG: ABC transporter permease [Eubacteriales bacterium]|nr:ABC transporter permease [Eubacteriales bacterium]